MNRADGKVMNQVGLHEKWDYDTRTDGQPVYHGVAAPGIATSQRGWVIEKFTFTTISGSDYATDKAVADNVIWDNRASLSYI